jgi:hypothetical protein
MRMLTPRELARAQAFPDSYDITAGGRLTEDRAASQDRQQRLSSARRGNRARQLHRRAQASKRSPPSCLAAGAARAAARVVGRACSMGSQHDRAGFIPHRPRRAASWRLPRGAGRYRRRLDRSVVTDPPYALGLDRQALRQARRGTTKDGDVYSRASAGFMGQQWDTGETAFAAEFWAQVLRVLKPGGHIVAFSGTRTYHRMVCAIEDAGFEIRDQLAWVYGSGFPKSHDISKAIDKLDAAAERRRRALSFTAWSARRVLPPAPSTKRPVP